MFSLLESKPAAYAEVKGYQDYPELSGSVKFFEVYGGTIVEVYIKNLPMGNGFHGFHIHEENSCLSPGKHFSLGEKEHPDHEGDMPPLLACDGTVFSIFYTNRFYPEDVIGKTVVIHASRDDFSSQPSGNPGEMIACGEIKVEKQETRFKVKRRS